MKTKIFILCANKKLKQSIFDFITDLKIIPVEIEHLHVLPFNSFVITNNESSITEAYKKGAKAVFLYKDNESYLETLKNELKKVSHSFYRGPIPLRTFHLNFLDEFQRTLNYATNPNIPLLLRGETGTGKTHIARLIHNSVRKNEAFISVNISEISESLLESQLFGHKKGAFTGAINDHKGLIEQAENGTLFLDEIGSLPLTIQVKLLKVIEEKVILPVGSHTPKKINFHLITATCENLEEHISKGQMRRDFFYRLNGHQFLIPPLSERKDDLALLLNEFQEEYAKQLLISEEVLQKMKDYHWPGNVRELSQVYHQLHCQESPIIKSWAPPVQSASDSAVISPSLPKQVDALELEVFTESFKRNNGKTNRICNELGISKSVFYRLQDRLLSLTA